MYDHDSLAILWCLLALLANTAAAATVTTLGLHREKHKTKNMTPSSAHGGKALTSVLCVSLIVFIAVLAVSLLHMLGTSAHMDLIHWIECTHA